MASVFKYRDGWRAQANIPGRPHLDCRLRRDAEAWARDIEADHESGKAPRLGGPTRCTVAEMLGERARTYAIGLYGRKAEFNRINHYLRGAGMPLLKPVCLEDKWHVVETDATTVDGKVADGWQAHLQRRRDQRTRTYDAIAALAVRRVSTLTKGDIQDLMTVMRTDGLSESTIQKEIAMLKAAFNIAIDQWNWAGFGNPCSGLKLGKSMPRFVRVSSEELQRIYRAAAECDNPYFLALVDCAIFLTARQGSLLELRWDQIDFEGRNAYLKKTKTGPTLVPLPARCAMVLRPLPRHPSGLVFPLTDNAVDMAWDGVRKKAGVDRLQFRDLRHLGGTHYARRLPAHLLRELLGHKTLHQATVYVNLASQDVVDALDSTEPDPLTLPPMPGAVTETMGERRAKRLNRLVREEPGVDSSVVNDPAPAPTALQAGDNVIPFPRAAKQRPPEAPIVDAAGTKR